MTLWGWVLLASLGAYALKLGGWLVPLSVTEHPLVARATSAMTVGLLASLVTLNSIERGGALAPDARLIAVGVAGVALWLRLPYLVVVIAGAAAAALARAAGLP